MGEAYFYHLTRRPLESTLPVLLEKSLAQGWRVIVRGVDDQRLDWLDERLWLGPEERFLPHGRDGGPHDARQPVLLTSDPNQVADCLISIDGAPVLPREVTAGLRTCILFDGNDDQAVQHARGQWKNLTDAGCGAQYWSEAEGNWTKKAETPARN